MTLSELKVGQKGTIKSLLSYSSSLLRLQELGLTKGNRIQVIKKAPLGDPIEVQVLNGSICLRKSEASFIEVSTV